MDFLLTDGKCWHLPLAGWFAENNLSGGGWQGVACARGASAMVRGHMGLLLHRERHKGSLCPAPPEVLVSAVGPGLLLLPVQGTLPVPAEPGRGLHPGVPEESGAVLGGDIRGEGRGLQLIPPSSLLGQSSSAWRCLYQVSSSELHPRIGFGRLLVPPAHLLLQPPQQLPLEGAQPCRGPGRRCRPSEGLPGADAQSRAGTAGPEGGRAHRAGLGPEPHPKACGVPAE